MLDPRSFASSSTGPRWIGVDNCVWEGPVDLLDKTPLASISEYRTNQQIVQLFHNILDIRDANWTDYIRTLSKLKANPNASVNIAERVLGLYRLFLKSNISDMDWDLI